MCTIEIKLYLPISYKIVVKVIPSPNTFKNIIKNTDRD